MNKSIILFHFGKGNKMSENIRLLFVLIITSHHLFLFAECPISEKCFLWIFPLILTAPLEVGANILQQDQPCCSKQS